jgi:hypothetical protein
MTLVSLTDRDDYTGTGAVDTYPYTYKIFDEADLHVIQTDLTPATTVLTLNVDYTVTGVGEENGGTIVLVAGNLASGWGLSILRKKTIQQLTDLRNQGELYAETLEDTYDISRMIDQQQQSELDKSLHLSDFDATGVDAELPAPEANKFLSWNSAATAIENIAPGSVALAVPADGSVSTPKIVDLAVTTAKLAAGAVTQPKVNFAVESHTTTAPPTPTVGVRYIVASGATGTWSGHDGEIAEGTGSGWTYETPLDGWLAYAKDQDEFVKFDGSVWVILAKAVDVIVNRDDYASDTLAGAALKAILEDSNVKSVVLKSGTYEVSADITQAAAQFVLCERDAIIKLNAANTTLFVGVNCRWYNGIVDGNSVGGDATDGLVNVGAQIGIVIIGMAVRNSANDGLVGTTTDWTGLDGLAVSAIISCRFVSNGGDGAFRCGRLQSCTSSNNGAHGFSDCHDLRGCSSEANVDEGFSNCEVLTNCISISDGDRGFETCRNLTGCNSFDAGSVAFYNCDLLSACEARDPASQGFVLCNNMTGCVSDGNLSGAAFDQCDQISGCTATDANTVGFLTCKRLSSCRSGSAGTASFELCINLSACVSDQPQQHGFLTCENLSGCFSNDAGQAGGNLYDGFNNSNQIAGCDSDNSDRDGYNTCNRVTGSRAVNNDVHGFNTCNRLAGNGANSNGDDGYNNCNEVDGCSANGNTDNGFDTCQQVSGCFSTNHSGAGDVGFQSCDRVASSHSTLDTTARNGGTPHDNLTTKYSISAW